MRPACLLSILAIFLFALPAFPQEDWKERGESLLKEGKYAEALEVYSKARQKEPENIPALLGIGKAHLSMGQEDRAIRILEEAYKLERENREVLFTLGLALYAQAETLRRDAETGVGGAGRFWQVAFEDAKVKFMRVSRIDPLYVMGYQYTGLCHAALGQTGDAEQAYRKALRLSPKNPSSNLLLGKFLLYTKGNPDEALPFLKEAELLSFDRIEAGREVSKCLVEQGKSEEGKSKLVSLLSQYPNKTALLEDLWRLLEPSSAPDRAVAFFRDLFENNRKNTLSLWYSGQVLFNEEKYEEARAEYRRLQELEPAMNGILVNIGLCFQREGNLEKARESFASALEADSKNPAAVTQTRLLAQEMADRGQFEDSISLFKKLTMLDAGNALLMGDYGLTLRNAGEYESSLSIYRKAIALDPKDSQLLNDIGLVYEGMRNFEEALRWYEKSERLDRNLDAMENRGVIYFKYGKYTDAENQFRKVLEIDSERERSKLYFYRCKRMTHGRKKR